MLRSAQHVLRARPSQRVLAGARRTVATVSQAPSRTAVVGFVTLAGAAAVYASTSAVHADAPNFVGNAKEALNSAEALSLGMSGSDGADWLSASVDPKNDTLISLMWGSNKGKTIAPASASDNVRIPTNVEWLSNVALRDLTLEETHAACVDARGDVYQWGSEFSQETKDPQLTLRGKNITALASTPTRLFALSSTGHVYALSSRASAQVPSGSQPPASSSWFGIFGGEENTIDFVQLSAPLVRGEKITQIAAGTHHLLARTSNGRALALALGPRANSHGQLGLRRISTSTLGKERELLPDSVIRERTPEMRATPPITIRSPSQSKPTPVAVEDDIRFAGATFQEIPALHGIQVAQLAAGARSSLARTEDGRVLAWGANEFGQLGLGGKMTLGTITRPTEVVLSRGMPTGTRVVCTNIAAAGDLTFFTVERSGGSAAAGVDVLACGNGQFGGLGAALYSNAQGQPSRVKNISGLVEYSEKMQGLQPIRPYAITLSTTGHVLCTLDTLSQAQTPEAGRDLYVWGANGAGELGNGRRASSALPGLIESSTGRFMLSQRTAREVRDMRGSVWKRGVRVEQCAVAGPTCSAVYWRIC